MTRDLSTSLSKGNGIFLKFCTNGVSARTVFGTFFNEDIPVFYVPVVSDPGKISQEYCSSSMVEQSELHPGLQQLLA